MVTRNSYKSNKCNEAHLFDTYSSLNCNLLESFICNKTWMLYIKYLAWGKAV